MNKHTGISMRTTGCLGAKEGNKQSNQVSQKRRLSAKKHTICIDLDGTICSTENPRNYDSAKILPGVKELMRSFFKRFKIVIYTARKESDREVTEKWLQENQIPYHELILEKPQADIYLDNKGFRFNHLKKNKSVEQKEVK